VTRGYRRRAVWVRHGLASTDHGGYSVFAMLCDALQVWSVQRGMCLAMGAVVPKRRKMGAPWLSDSQGLGGCSFSSDGSALFAFGGEC
jgi:hypothetical protein